jgi:hypothetical protein
MNKLKEEQERMGQYASYSKGAEERARMERETGMVHFITPSVCYRELMPLACFTLVLGHFPVSVVRKYRRG